MAPKRAAATAAKVPRAAKAAKVDPTIERCKGVFALLKEFGASKLPPSCLNMLRETAPLALATGKDERHKYQTEVVTSISDLCGDLVKDRAALVREAEAEVADSATAKERMQTQLTQLCAVEEAKREAKSVASAALERATDAENDAKAGLEAAKKEVAETESHIVVNTADKEKFEATFAESWPPLRDGTFSTKDWRARNKLVGVVVAMLTTAPESLRSGLSQALKEKPEARGQFAQKTIEYAEAAFQEHIAGMAAEISRLSSALEAARASVEQAESRLQADTTAKDQAWETSIAAENAWVEADSEVFNVKSQIANFDSNQAAKYREVDMQKALQERLRELIADFESLRDCTGVDAAGDEPAEADVAITAE